MIANQRGARPVRRGGQGGLRRCFLAVLVVAPFAGTPVQASVGEGVAAYKEGRFETARAALERPARRGDAEAQFYLGLMYHNGQGGRSDPGRALDLMRRASANGHPIAPDVLPIIEANQPPRPRAQTTRMLASDATGTGRFEVQLGSFVNPSNAQRVWNRLASNDAGLLQHLNHRVMARRLGDGRTVHRLLAGPLSSRRAASDLCGQLENEGVHDDCIAVGR